MADKKPLEESPVGRAVSDQAEEQDTVQERGQETMFTIRGSLYKNYIIGRL